MPCWGDKSRCPVVVMIKKSCVSELSNFRSKASKSRSFLVQARHWGWEDSESASQYHARSRRFLSCWTLGGWSRWWTEKADWARSSYVTVHGRHGLRLCFQHILNHPVFHSVWNKELTDVLNQNTIHRQGSRLSRLCKLQTSILDLSRGNEMWASQRKWVIRSCSSSWWRFAALADALPTSSKLLWTSWKLLRTNCVYKVANSCADVLITVVLSSGRAAALLNHRGFPSIKAGSGEGSHAGSPILLHAASFSSAEVHHSTPLFFLLGKRLKTWQTQNTALALIEL